MRFKLEFIFSTKKYNMESTPFDLILLDDVFVNPKTGRKAKKGKKIWKELVKSKAIREEDGKYVYFGEETVEKPVEDVGKPVEDVEKPEEVVTVEDVEDEKVPGINRTMSEVEEILRKVKDADPDFYKMFIDFVSKTNL